MLIDVQRNMLEPPTPVPAAASIRDALQDLLLRARQAGALVIHVQNDGSPGDPDEPGTDGWQLVFPAGSGELIVRKDQTDTFAANPGLAGELAAKEITEVIIAGMQSNYCVAESSRGALKQGLQAILASGAHATYDEDEPGIRHLCPDRTGARHGRRHGAPLRRRQLRGNVLAGVGRSLRIRSRLTAHHSAVDPAEPHPAQPDDRHDRGCASERIPRCPTGGTG